MKILFFGDVFGNPGRKAIQSFLPEFLSNHHIDFVIANCENASDGKGITEKSAKELFDAGVHAFTSGNHLWDKKDGITLISTEKRIVKPLNFPSDAPGFNYTYLKNRQFDLVVACLCGQSFMNPIDSPFFALDRLLPELYSISRNILIDFHAESTAEKRTFGHYFDGKVSAILGTHTHIQTADEEILDEGTAYITDVGMTGSVDSVIGVKKEIALERVKTGLPVRHQTSDKKVYVNAVLITLNSDGKAEDIQRIRQKIFD